MADKKISQLPTATIPLAGTEVLPIVQSGATDQVSVANLTAGRAVSADSLTLTGNLTVDTTTLKVDATNNYVGIGLASPAYQADILSPLTGTTAGSNAILNVSSNASGRDSHIRLNDNVNASGRIGYLSGDLYMWTNAGQRFTVQTNGDCTVNTGNLVIGTSGKGIDFSATGQASGMTSELLNDYEEGDWTPTISRDTAPTLTYTAQVGKYVKIGRQVTASGSVFFTVTGSGGGLVYIRGLPFAAMNVGFYATSGSVSYSDGISTGADSVYTQQLSTDLVVCVNGGLAGGTLSSGRIYFSITYMV